MPRRFLHFGHRRSRGDCQRLYTTRLDGWHTMSKNDLEAIPLRSIAIEGQGDVCRLDIMSIVPAPRRTSIPTNAKRQSLET